MANLEKLRKSRGHERAAATKTINAVELEVTKAKEDIDEEELEYLMTSLESHLEKLADLNSNVYGLMMEMDAANEDFEDERTAADKYLKKLSKVRSKILKLLKSQGQVSSRSVSPTGSASEFMRSHRSLRSATHHGYKLPKIELRKFGGELKDWLGWWAQFQKIHEDKDLHSSDKIQYLCQSVVAGTRAKELIESYPQTADNYPKVIEALKSRFGRKDLLIEVYVRELLKLVIENSLAKGKVKISCIFDKLESYLRALESIGVTSKNYAAMLYPLVESCLPEDLLRIWHRMRSCNVVQVDLDTQGNRLIQLLGFLKSEVESEERICLAREGFGVGTTHPKGKKQPVAEVPMPTATGLFSGENGRSGKSLCCFCEKTHSSHECFQARKMSLSDKKKILSSKRCCFSCLKIGHPAVKCRNRVNCVVCGRRHYAIICPDLPIHKIEKEDDKAKDEQKDDHSSTTFSNQSCTSSILLQTLVVTMKGNGCQRKARAIIDTGSQKSYILKKSAEELGFPVLSSEYMVHLLFGGIQSEKQSHEKYEVTVTSDNGHFSVKFEALDQPVICGNIPRICKGPWFAELKSKKIWVSDVGSNCPEIELLIGADVIAQLWTGRVEKLKSGPVAVETKLGWTLMGQAPSVQSKSYSTLMVTSLLTQESSMANLWSLETIGIRDPSEVKSKLDLETAAKEYFRQTVCVNSDGRYEVSLPWVEGHAELKENRWMAEKRLISATKKLNDVGRFKDYDTVFREWLSEGIIEEVPKDSSIGGWFLPHRPVFKQSSSTTKIRPVYDASARLKTHPSLNDCLEKGPNLIELIPSLLLRFREKKIGVISDIRKAFLQIAVKKEDCEFLKFLWWESEEDRTIKVFRHCRVVFGVNCSPFLLGAVIEYHLENAPPPLIKTGKKLSKSFYVDNCITSVDSKKELNCFVKESTELMSTAKFDLRLWEYSSQHGNAQVLGLLWDKEEDVLYCDVKDVSISLLFPTRRNILSLVQRVFDPIGFTCPALVSMKILLQESWALKTGWDEELPEEMGLKFKKWVSEVKMLSEVRIPRHLSSFGCPSDGWSLHTFCDASGLAYSAVVFLRCVVGEQVEVKFVQAKSRISPLKKLTIPRLELLAATIGSRLTATVVEGLGLEDVRRYFWSDSTTVLNWIARDDSWGAFVGNRVKEICQLTRREEWGHVPGKCNPADLPSRGCTVRTLVDSHWWEGPNWLKLSEEFWPKSEVIPDEVEIDKEKKKSVVSSMLCKTVAPITLWSKFSRYSQIVQMIGWMLRFVKNTRTGKEHREVGLLTVIELDIAENDLIKLVQSQCFSTKMLKMSGLGTFEDNYGVLRVKTKIMRRNDSKDFTTPILLPSSHPVTIALIREQHDKLCHAGTQLVLSRLRERFWILRGRKSVNAVVSKCVICRRFNTKKLESATAPLPEDRVRNAGIFEITGIDLAGPLYLKNKEKVWICLYTCAVYRAVHLEIVSNLSTDSFLQCLRRFVARRGRPSIVYSDNGTNFVGADNLFKSVDWKVVESLSTAQRIQWKFNPPSAPWYGGWWERLVRIVKQLLRRVLGKTSLNYEELMTVLCDCEAVINSRPLTYVSEDPFDLTPLTPAMFLQDIPEVGVPELDQLDAVSAGKRYVYRQRVKEDLRRRFRSEYLGQLADRRLKKEEYRSLDIGDIVLIGSDNSKRMDWPLGKIIKLYPGKDGKVRVALVKTGNGELLRPIQRLYPLEVTSGDQQVNNIDQPAEKVSGGNLFRTRYGRKVKKPEIFQSGVNCDL